MIYSISVIIPAFNDEISLPSLISETNKVLIDISSSYEILVVNDASIDQTSLVLEKMKFGKLRFWSHSKNKGHGKTLKELYLKASKQLIFSLPGNGQIRPQEIFKLLPHIGEFDMVIGVRKLRHVPLRRKIQSKVYNFLIKVLYDLELSDVNSIRLLKKSKLDKIRLLAKTSFVDAELCYKFSKKGFGIAEVPITHLPGESRGGGSLRTILPTFIETIVFWLNLRSR